MKYLRQFLALEAVPKARKKFLILASGNFAIPETLDWGQFIKKLSNFLLLE